MKPDKHHKAILALFLAAVVSLSPAAVFAEETGAETPENEIVSELPEETGSQDAEEEQANETAEAPEAQAPEEEPEEAIPQELTIGISGETDRVPDLPDGSDLLEGYLLQQAREDLGQAAGSDEVSPEGLPEAGASSRADQLSDKEQIVYGRLRAKFAEVADGSTGSATFTITMRELLGGKMSYTMEELGITEFNSEQIQEATARLLSFDLDAALEAALADSPYEAYWFDKTAGVYYSMSGAPVSLSGNIVTYGDGSNLVFYLYVSSDYSVSGGTDTYDADTAKTSAAAAAASNAAAIVQYASEQGYGDYDKLYYYMQRICVLTEYNYPAAQGGAEYGDPWQLIYVFDGDSSTKVVCEGYSKALKYLVDLSTFRSSLIDCRLVYGTMEAANSSGPHMWNVVRMNDGKNYLVDLTNSDNGSSLSSDLVLRGCADGTDLGYTIRRSGGWIRYTYDEGVLSIYTEEERTLAAEDYVPGTPDYQETVELTASNTTLSAIPDQVWSGSAKEPALVVTCEGKVLEKDTDYTVTYYANVGVGKASAKIIGTGGYTGTLFTTFTILPKGTNFTGLTGESKAFRVRWTKVPAQISGYQIQYSTNKSFSGASVAYASASADQLKVSGLVSRKGYYVRIRSYYKADGQFYYSAWSSVRSVGTK